VILAIVKRGSMQISDQAVTAINLKNVAKPGKPHRIKR
jgi:hypothetical protein